MHFHFPGTSSEVAANGTVPTSTTTGKSRDIAVPILSAVVGVLAIFILTMTFIALAIGVCAYMRRKNKGSKGRVSPQKSLYTSRNISVYLYICMQKTKKLVHQLPMRVQLS